MNPPTIARHMAKGAAWMVAMRWAMRLTGMVNVLILARLLSPADFGVAVMAWIVVELLVVLADANVDIALLRNSKAGRDHYDTAWTLAVISGLGTCLALQAVAPLAALYYDDERVRWVIAIVGLRPAILGFENIGVVRFRADFDFAREFRYWVARRLVMFAIGLGLAFWLRDWRALTVAAPIAAVVTVIISYWMSDYRPRFRLTHWRELWSFSRWAIVSCTSRFASQRMDEFIIGGVGSAADIGGYYVASDIATMPTRDVIQAVGRALTPTYARIAHDHAEIRAALRGVLGFTAILCLAAGTGMAVIAEDAVPVLLGSQWRDSAQIFRWLALYGTFEGFFLAMEPYMQVRGHQRAFALANLAYLAVLAPTLVGAGNALGIEAIAVTRLLVMAAAVAALFVLVVRAGWLSAGDLLAVVWRPAIAAAAMAVAVTGLHQDWGMPLLSMLADIATGATVFLAALAALWRVAGCPDGPERAMLARIIR